MLIARLILSVALVTLLILTLAILRIFHMIQQGSYNFQDYEKEAFWHVSLCQKSSLPHRSNTDTAILPGATDPFISGEHVATSGLAHL